MKPTIPATVAVGLAFSSTVRAEWVLALYTGTSRTQASDLQVRQESSGSDAEFQSVHWQARPFEDAPYYGFRISYFPGSATRLGTSLDFTHYKMYAETDRVVAVRGRWNGAPVDESSPMSSRISDFQISHGVNLTALNVSYRWRAPTERLQPHVGGGLVVYVPHAEGSINGVPTSGNYQTAGIGYQVFAGAEYRLWRRIGLLIEAKFDDGHLDIDLEPRAQAKTNVRTLHAVAGIAVHL